MARRSDAIHRDCFSFVSIGRSSGYHFRDGDPLVSPARTLSGRLNENRFPPTPPPQIHSETSGAADGDIGAFLRVSAGLAGEIQIDLPKGITANSKSLQWSDVPNQSPFMHALAETKAMLQ